MYSKNAIGRRVSVLSLALVIFILLLGSACYIPGIIEPTEATDPPQGAVTGDPEIFYGKFIYYQVGGGKIQRLGGGKIDYFVGDEVYFPTSDPNLKPQRYNFQHTGNEKALTFHYKEASEDLYVASGRPDAIVLRTQLPGDDKHGPALALFYTDSNLALVMGNNYEGSSGEAGDTPATATPITTGQAFYAMFSSLGDVDVFSIDLTAPSVLSIQGRFSQVHGASSSSATDNPDRHRLLLRLLGPTSDSDPTLIEYGRSSHGVDFMRYQDPDLAVVIPVNGTYYLEVSDLKRPLEFNNSADSYRILIDWSGDPNVGHIMKGEIQPARSCDTSVVDGYTAYSGCSEQLRGRGTFEPDDLRTEIKDVWPDCDGIPGNGNEGDAGIYEMCGATSQFGGGDGVTQYQEVDDKTTIDDGEYFVGKPTNVPAFVDTETSIIRTPDDKDPATPDSLSMFVAYNNGIYWLESLDGQTGLEWNLATLYGGTVAGGTNVGFDTTAVAARNKQNLLRDGNPTTPIITSGALGFCDTVPADGDTWGAPELKQFADDFGITPTATGAYTNSPTGYPNTVGITFGGNGVLDSIALVDETVGNTITSGTDGIINTFFAPTYVAYSQVLFAPPGYINTTPMPMVFPGNTFNTRGMNGPGTPDNPPIFDILAMGYVYPLSDPLSGIFSGQTLLDYQAITGSDTLGGNDQLAFLLGDDEWNPEIFHGDTLTPAAYWRKQRCSFYAIGSNYDRCVMGLPEVGPDATGVQVPGEEPVMILSGKDGRLDTVDQLLKNYRGDDVLCHDGETVGICPGPDGRFGWQDIYIPIKGDDRLAIVHDGATTTIGISSGLNGTLETTPITGYTLFDMENTVVYKGGDIDGSVDPSCTDEFGNPAICPTREEYKIDFYCINPKFTACSGGGIESTRVHRLMSVWPMSVTAESLGLSGAQGYLVKKDLYNIYDDEFCIINGGPAICPGRDGVFQSYPLSRRVQVDEDDDLFALHDRVKSLVGKDCYMLRSELYTDTFSEKATIRYVFYHDLGIRMDDRVRWSYDRGYYVTTGRNGINQSCTVSSDEKVIPMWQGLADQPIITPGGDGVFQTYALKDEKFKWADNVYKINTGADGISNSYARGDDRLEIFMGTGKSDQPCVRSADGIADTIAQSYNLDSEAPIWTNDNQLYKVGERTGFDAFQVFGPKAVVLNNEIYLYYSALGWEEFPESFRNSSGALGDVGECRRPGFDQQWGDRTPDFSIRANDRPVSLYTYDFNLFELPFQMLLDNNESVGIMPRIGVATSTIQRLRKNPTDWTIRTKPALDVGQQCVGVIELPIDLGLDPSGGLPDSNYYGAYSPEVEFSETPDGHRLFLMFYTGLAVGEKDNSDLRTLSVLGMARSTDGLNFELVRQFNIVTTGSDFSIDALTGSGDDTHRAAPTIYVAGEDEYGQNMYGMFFNQFHSTIGENAGAASRNVDLRTDDHIGWALRRGMSYNSGFSCSMSPDTFADNQDRNRRILQFVILGLPVALAGIFGLSRRRKAKV